MNGGSPTTDEPMLSGVTAIIPCHNERDSVLRCLRSFGTPRVTLRVVLVDDGSSDGTAAAVAEAFPDVEIVTGDGSLWWSGAINRGLERAAQRPTSHVLLLNNDCILGDGVVDALMAVSRPDTIVSAAIHDAADGSPVSFGGQIHPRQGLVYFEQRQPIDDGGLSTVDWLPGHCLLIPASVLERTGPMDEARFPHYWGDADFTLRARRQGTRLTVAPDIVVLNDRGQTGIKVAEQQDLRALLRVLTSRRSWLRVDDNARFWWRHRRVVPLRVMVGRYGSTSVLIGRAVADRLHVRAPLRWLAHRAMGARAALSRSGRR